MSYRKKTALWAILLFAYLTLSYFFSPPENLLESAFLFALCFGSEFIDSTLGMGYGTMLTPLLLLLGYTPQEVVPSLLISEFLTGFAATFFHHHKRNIEIHMQSSHLRVTLLLLFGSAIGAFFGAYLSVTIPLEQVISIIGCIIVFSGLVVVLFYDKVVIYRKWKIILLSIVASFNKAFSGGGYGPLITSGQILCGIEGRASVAITSLTEAFTCLFGASIFYLSGVPLNYQLFIPMVAGALFSAPFAAHIVSIAKERNLRMVVGIMTIILGICTFFRGM